MTGRRGLAFGTAAKLMREKFLLTLIALAIDLQENSSNGKGATQIVQDKKLLSWPGRCEKIGGIEKA